MARSNALANNFFPNFHTNKILLASFFLQESEPQSCWFPKIKTATNAVVSGGLQSVAASVFAFLAIKGNEEVNGRMLGARMLCRFGSLTSKA